MTDSENDNLNNEEKKKDDDDLEDENEEKFSYLDDNFKYYDFDNNEMYTMYLKNSKINKVKIDKVNTSVSVSLYRVTE